MSRKVFVVGVGMTRFEKPGRREGWDYPAMVAESGSAALADAGVTFADVGEVYAGYVYGDSTSGQRAVYELGMTGVPVVNVNNNCATGSSALWLAARAVAGGFAGCALAVGFERMSPGSLSEVWTDRAARWSGTSVRWPSCAGRALRWHRGCSPRPAWSTWSGTARPPSSSRGSRRRTTSIR